MKGKKKYFCAVVLAAVLTGCVKREVIERPVEGELSLTYDWSRLPEGVSAPERMQLYLYGPEGEQVLLGSGPSAFTGKVAEGEYRVLAFNADASGVVFRNMEAYHTAEAYAPEGVTGVLYRVSLSSLKVDIHTPTVLTVTPSPCVKQVEIRIKASGEKAVSGRVRLSGVAPALNLSTGHTAGSAGVTVEGTLAADADGLKAVLPVMGMVRSGEAPFNELEIELDLESGALSRGKVDLGSAFGGFNRPEVGSVAVSLSVEAGAETVSVSDWTYKNTIVIEG